MLQYNFFYLILPFTFQIFINNKSLIYLELQKIILIKSVVNGLMCLQNIILKICLHSLLSKVKKLKTF